MSSPFEKDTNENYETFFIDFEKIIIKSDLIENDEHRVYKNQILGS